jgi:hypothetical protein
VRASGSSNGRPDGINSNSPDADVAIGVCACIELRAGVAVPPVEAFQLMFAVWSKTSRGRLRCDALSYAASCLSR